MAAAAAAIPQEGGAPFVLIEDPSPVKPEWIGEKYDGETSQKAEKRSAHFRVYCYAFGLCMGTAAGDRYNHCMFGFDSTVPV